MSRGEYKADSGRGSNGDTVSEKSRRETKRPRQKKEKRNRKNADTWISRQTNRDSHMNTADALFAQV